MDGEAGLLRAKWVREELVRCSRVVCMTRHLNVAELRVLGSLIGLHLLVRIEVGLSAALLRVHLAPLVKRKLHFCSFRHREYSKLVVTRPHLDPTQLT